MKSLEEILANTRWEPTTGCRIWLGCLINGGYGQVNWEGRNYLVHRLVWELTKGQSPGASKVLHTCDSPACCEFPHLFLGTQLDNVQDCIAKGRSFHPHGEQDGNHKLTEAQVVEIKRLLVLGEPQQRIASTYSVAPATIAHIARNATWKHVPWIGRKAT